MCLFKKGDGTAVIEPLSYERPAGSRPIHFLYILPPGSMSMCHLFIFIFNISNYFINIIFHIAVVIC